MAQDSPPDYDALMYQLGKVLSVEPRQSAHAVGYLFSCIAQSAPAALAAALNDYGTRDPRPRPEAASEIAERPDLDADGHERPPRRVVVGEPLRPLEPAPRP